MRYAYLLILTCALLISTRAAFAGCTAPEGENRTPCISCGNLEQNVERAFDLAWNAFLVNRTMQLELRTYGATAIHLVNPPHASPGVLYYTVIIEDPQFEIVNIETYAQALQLMHSWGTGFSYSGASLHAEWIWRQSLTTRIESALSVSVSTGSGPYIMRLVDSKGNVVPGSSIEQPRLLGQQQLALVGPRDLFPDDQYANDACVSEDPRHQGDSTVAGAGTNSGDDPSDNSDHWDAWGNGYGEIGALCRPDFSDPAGAGVICVI